MTDYTRGVLWGIIPTILFFAVVYACFRRQLALPLVLSAGFGPMIFFGCAYYPWAALSVLPWFQKFVLVNPLVYASEGFRAALTPQLPHMPLSLIFGGLAGFCVLFTYFGLRQFERRSLD